MALLNGQNFWKRLLTSGVVAWVSLALSITALVVSLRHANQNSPKPVENTLKPPDGYLLDPQRAKVKDARENTFSWYESIGDNQDGDHVTYSGWAADAERGEFLAYGRASIRGIMRSGILALARPDENRLHMEWPLQIKDRHRIQITCCLTDRAVKQTRRGAKVRMELARKGAASTVLADDEPLDPGDDKVIEITAPLVGNENKFILEIDNRGQEFWSVVYCTAYVE